MASLSGKRANPGSGGRRRFAVPGAIEDVTAEEAVVSLSESVLTPDMSRDFDEVTLDHIEYEVLAKAIEDGDEERAVLCEKVLAKYGRAVPNHVSGLWEPLDVPRNELQVRELFASRLPEYGYQLVCSQADFPDWLLLNKAGEFVYTEVEHRSSNFLSHGHGPEWCDLIACWEHDWSDSPLPVLEFFSGQSFPSMQKPPRKRHRGRLSINLSGRLSRYIPADTWGDRQKRSDALVARYNELCGQGDGGYGIVSTLANERGVTRQAITRALLVRGIRANPRRTRREEMSRRVSNLVASGLSRREAIDTVAQEFGIKRESVESSLSRYKNRT